MHEVRITAVVYFCAAVAFAFLFPHDKQSVNCLLVEMTRWFPCEFPYGFPWAFIFCAFITPVVACCCLCVQFITHSISPSTCIYFISLVLLGICGDRGLAYALFVYCVLCVPVLYAYEIITRRLHAVHAWCCVSLCVNSLVVIWACLGFP